jgi:hypothetical protein
LKTASGNYKAQLLNTITGSYSDPVLIKSIDGIITVEVDIPEGELALKITKE